MTQPELAARPTPRERHLRRTYGIGEHEYSALLRKQHGNCGVCKRPSTVFAKRLCVDHNHRTGEIRGLLCINCNRYVIGRLTDPEIFRAAAAYLSQGTGWFVPPKKKRKKRGRRSKSRNKS